MHQQIPPTLDQYGVQPQMAPLMICPVQFVYDTQIVLPQPAVPEELQPRPLLLNVQNPPPWHQNRPQNVIYVQQMPNQIPYMQQNIIPNIYPQYSYQIPQQIVPQDIIVQQTPQIEIEPKTENNVPPRSEKMPILTQLLNQKPLQTQEEKPVMLSQHVQTDFPLRIIKNTSNTIRETIAQNKLKNAPQLDGTTNKLDQAKQIGERNKIDKEIMRNETPEDISIMTYNPLLRPIVTPSGMKSTINNIPIKLRALDPTQVISIPNYGTLTNYTVVNEDKDLRIPTELQNPQSTNSDNIITAKLNEKNEITFTQNAQKYVPVMPNNVSKSFSVGTNTEPYETRKVTNKTSISVANETQTADKIVANNIAKPLTIVANNMANPLIKIVANNIAKPLTKIVANNIAKPITNDNSMTVKNMLRNKQKNETITQANNVNDARKTMPNETLTTFTSGTLKTVMTGTPKTIKIGTLKTVTLDTSETVIKYVKKVPNDAPKEVSIQPETIKSIEVKKITQKVEKNTEKEFDQPLVETVSKSKTIEPKPKTIQDIKKKIATKNVANDLFRKNDIYILTHVLDGHVIQESNVAFPIYAPAKENYSYEPFHEVARRKRTEESPLPLKNLHIHDNAKTIEEPIQVTLVPNRPIDNEALNDRRLATSSPITPAEVLTYPPSEVSTNPHEIIKNTKVTHEVSMINKETISNIKEVAAKTEPLKPDTLKGCLKVVEESIERCKERKNTKRLEVAADPIDRSEVGTNTKNKTEVAAITPKNVTNRQPKVPMVSIERLKVATISLTPHEVAAGSVNTNKLAVNVTVESMNTSNGIKVNNTSENQNDCEGNKVTKEDNNPFAMLQKSTVERWNMDTLFSCLTKNNWNETAGKLKEHEIDGEALLLANKDQLIAIGVEEKQADIINTFIVNCNTVVIESDEYD